MKYLSKIIIAISLLYSSISSAQNAQYEILDKSYTPADKSTTLEIANSFGNVTLAVWDKNSISVKITLEVEGYDEKEARKILDKIELETNESANLISIETDLKRYIQKSSRKKSFKINYQINMPDGHPLSISNEFGNIYMPDYSGNSTINLEFGNLTAGNLTKLNLKHEFGKGEIESITAGNFNLEYVDEFSLANGNELELTAEFSKIDIRNIKTINFSIDYGKLIVGTVSNYEGNSEFSRIGIDAVYDNFKLNAEYASGTIELKQLSKDIKSFQLDTEFSKSEINVEKGANLSFESEHSFGKMNIEGSNVRFSKIIKDMTDEAFEGTIGDQADQIKTILKINTNYGACTIIAD
jgi:hypothetical protein